MFCPECSNQGHDIEMELVSGVTRKATSPLEDEETGEWLECPDCGYQCDNEGQIEEL